MKKSIKLSAACLCFFISLNFSCGKEGGGGVFLPDLSSANGWANRANASNTFFLFIDKPNESTSTFTGNENPIGGGAQFNFSGSYTNHDIAFKYTNGVRSGKGYSGTINEASNVITLTSTDAGLASPLVLDKK
jgi:hypothetical protein